jgi:hypothetical protein
VKAVIRVQDEHSGKEATPSEEEETMAYGRGHCRGTKKERKGAQDWFKKIEEANIRRVEQAWAAKQASAK